MTIEKDRTTSLTATLNNDDREEDGLLDYYEEHGYIDGFGNPHTSDPDLTDTDGDGHSDYEEHFDPDYDPPRLRGALRLDGNGP
ncbi:MAG: hypothetical protein PHP59_03380 [Methanofollis sp.]|uniref:hypothetical protein n=1 Tax=Methanofollis sp. TaxID=2052835 RepID=UPI00262FCBF2|nr:hypothetical protein [Methanofollis sp.]MDD4254397.1 hypothetical protein [Methanofollis sp.]